MIASRSANEYSNVPPVLVVTLAMRSLTMAGGFFLNSANRLAERTLVLVDFPALLHLQHLLWTTSMLAVGLLVRRRSTMASNEGCVACGAIARSVGKGSLL